jgi:RNA polymerase sigma factor (sigma-70 family)
MEINKDSILWEEFRKGSLKAFDTIYYLNVRVLYNYGHKITADSAIIEDSIQDLFIELWQKREHLSPTSSIKYYLFKAISQKIIRRLKVENRLNERFSLSNDYDFQVVFSHEVHLITNQISEDERKNLQSALETLTGRQKQAIYLKFFEGLSFDEVADILSINTKATYKLIARAIEVLRSSMLKHLILLFVSIICLFF